MDCADDQALVLLSEVDPVLEIDLRLASAEHPLGRVCYRSATAAYLRRGTAEKLAAAHQAFRKKGLRLKVWESYRPFIVQEQLFHHFGGNADWVSDPYNPAGLKTHVRGVAIDCTLLDDSGGELAMPTAYLDFAEGAKKMKHDYADLPPDVLANRAFLKETMLAHGLQPYRGEWWHYQDAEYERYPLIAKGDFQEVHQALLSADLLAEWDSPT